MGRACRDAVYVACLRSLRLYLATSDVFICTPCIAPSPSICPGHRRFAPLRGHLVEGGAGMLRCIAEPRVSRLHCVIARFACVSGEAVWSLLLVYPRAPSPAPEETPLPIPFILVLACVWSGRCLVLRRTQRGVRCSFSFRPISSGLLPMAPPCDTPPPPVAEMRQSHTHRACSICNIFIHHTILCLASSPSHPLLSLVPSLPLRSHFVVLQR